MFENDVETTTSANGVEIDIDNEIELQEGDMEKRARQEELQRRQQMQEAEENLTDEQWAAIYGGSIYGTRAPAVSTPVPTTTRAAGHSTSVPLPSSTMVHQQLPRTSSSSNTSNNNPTPTTTTNKPVRVEVTNTVRYYTSSYY